MSGMEETKPGEQQHPYDDETLELREGKIPIWMTTTQAFFAGWVAGGAGIVVGQPFDTIKTLQQTSYSRNCPHSTKLFTSVWSEYGVKGLYRGMAYPLVTYGLVNAAFFCGAETARTSLINHRKNRNYSDPEKLTYGEIFMIGCAGGIFQLPFVGPTELVKIRLQDQLQTGKKLYRGPTDCARKLYKSGGLDQIFRGMWSCVLRDVYAWGVYLVSFEFVRDKLQSIGFSHVPAELTGGGVAGFCSWALATPFDVVKSRIQASNKRLSTTEAIRLLYNEGGLKTFTRGIFMSSIRGFPANAVVLYSYAEFMRYFARHNEQKYLSNE